MLKHIIQFRSGLQWTPLYGSIIWYIHGLVIHNGLVHTLSLSSHSEGRMQCL